MIYNASVEQRIYSLIAEAKENPGNAVEFLQQARGHLDEGFVFHKFDSAEQNAQRIKSKVEIYGRIVDSYEGLLRLAELTIPLIPEDLKKKMELGENDFSKLFTELRNYMQINEDLKEKNEGLNLETNQLVKECEETNSKREELEKKVAGFEESQKSLEDI